MLGHRIIIIILSLSPAAFFCIAIAAPHQGSSPSSLYVRDLTRGATAKLGVSWIATHPAIHSSFATSRQKSAKPRALTQLDHRSVPPLGALLVAPLPFALMAIAATVTLGRRRWPHRQGLMMAAATARSEEPPSKLSMHNFQHLDDDRNSESGDEQTPKFTTRGATVVAAEVLPGNYKGVVQRWVPRMRFGFIYCPKVPDCRVFFGRSGLTQPRGQLPPGSLVDFMLQKETLSDGTVRINATHVTVLSVLESGEDFKETLHLLMEYLDEAIQQYKVAPEDKARLTAVRLARNTLQAVISRWVRESVAVSNTPPDFADSEESRRFKGNGASLAEP